MKLADYLADFLSAEGVRHVFAIAGGASLHLIDSIGKHENIQLICPQHEQGAAMAADGYSRMSGNIGVAMVTSGPGATNLLTGVCSAYYDSVPLLLITGQVSRSRMKGGTGVRQIGFQETDTVEIFKPITKHAVQLTSASDIRYELEKCLHISKSGRPGPVLLDIPDDLQRVYIDPNLLKSFTPLPRQNETNDFNALMAMIANYIDLAERPVLILGAGIRLAKAEIELFKLIDKLGIPFVPTWAVADILPSTHPLYIGTFGTHGTRHANFAVQNADLIISVGSRLDTKATGSPISSFARGAKKVVVDIDINELNKFEAFGLKIDVAIEADARFFLKNLNEIMAQPIENKLTVWLKQIADWRERHPVGTGRAISNNSVDPYYFVKALSDRSSENELIVSDTGCTLAWMMQGFKFKANQRLFHDWNNTAMGWAVPASVGISLTSAGGQVVCVIGDGSLMMSIQELATIVRYRLPVKIFLFNNKGYAMIRQTQDQWLDSRYFASSNSGGLASVNFMALAESFGFKCYNALCNEDVRVVINTVMKSDEPTFCNVVIDENACVVPQVKFGRPNEDSEPLLSREQFLKEMIVTPLDVSL